MSQPNSVGNRLSGEINIESIQASEEQIREHERAIIKLKRARNASLNIFWRDGILKDNFDGLEKGSRNFRFVCHHWFEVASNTPKFEVFRVISQWTWRAGAAIPRHLHSTWCRVVSNTMPQTTFST